MMPIQDLLNRIHWDREFGRADFEIAYYDRCERDLVRIPLAALHAVSGDHFAFDLTTAGGEVISVPYHRVREVYRDGRLIWQRPPKAP